MQENGGYGTNSPVNRLSDNVDEVIMDITNDTYPESNRNIGREESSMISNLPLLFANGHPTSLEKITMVHTYQLSYLISYVQICIVFREFHTCFVESEKTLQLHETTI